MRVFLQDDFRPRGLECSVLRSLAKRGLVQRSHRIEHWQKGAHIENVRVEGWRLTEEGERVARVCALKRQLAGKPAPARSYIDEQAAIWGMERLPGESDVSFRARIRRVIENR